MESRIKDMTSQIERLEANREEQIQRRIKSLVGGKAPRAKPAAKNRPAANSAVRQSEAAAAGGEQITN